MDTNGAIALIATTNFQHQPRMTRINTNFVLERRAPRRPEMFMDLRVSSLRNCYGLPRDTRTCSRPALVGAVYPNRPGDWGQLPLPIFSFLRSHGAVRVWDWGAYASSSATGPHTGRIRPKAKRIRRGERVSRCVSRRLSSLN